MKRVRYLLLIVLLLIIAGCSAPFHVTPRVDLPTESIKLKASNSLLELRAEILDEDEIVQLFDGNLSLAGMIPIRIWLLNKSTQPLPLSQWQVRLFNRQGRKIDGIKAKDALKKLVKYYGIRFYNPTFYDEMKEKFYSHSLDLQKSLASGESRQGIIYFKKEKDSPIPLGFKLEMRDSKEKQLYLQLGLN